MSTFRRPWRVTNPEQLPVRFTEIVCIHHRPGASGSEGEKIAKATPVMGGTIEADKRAGARQLRMYNLTSRRIPEHPVETGYAASTQSI
jgi:hypothetical protein